MRINPKAMAEIYWLRLKGRSFREVDAMIKQLENSPESRDYWITVKAFLEGCGIKMEKKH